MSILTKAAAATGAAALAAGMLASPAAAEPRPEDPTTKSYTTRTATCEWRDPDTDKKKHTKLSIKFTLEDGEATQVHSWGLRGKKAPKPIYFDIWDHTGDVTTAGDLTLVAKGELDQRGRAGAKRWYSIQGDTITVVLLEHNPELFDPDTWESDLCIASIDVP